MKENNGKINKTRTRFFRGIKNRGELDTHTFNIWKAELQKDLYTFWESITDSGRQK